MESRGLKSPEPGTDTPERRAAWTRHPGLDPGWGDRVPSNNVQRFREGLMMSKAELARKAGLSTLTVDRVEAGRPCRLDTKRKILLALGMKITDKDKVFGAADDAEGPALGGSDAGEGERP